MAMKITLLMLLTSLTCNLVTCNSLLSDAVDLSYDTEDGNRVTNPMHTTWKQTIKVRGPYEGVGGLYLENNDLTQVTNDSLDTWCNIHYK